MLKILLEKGLSNVLIIVTRYFGGILLGTGGLVRAYSESLLKALEKTNYINKTKGNIVEFEVAYEKFDKVKYELEKRKIRMIKIEYLENIKIEVEICKEVLNQFTKFNSNFILRQNILEEKYIEI